MEQLVLLVLKDQRVQTVSLELQVPLALPALLVIKVRLVSQGPQVPKVSLVQLVRLVRQVSLVPKAQPV